MYEFLLQTKEEWLKRLVVYSRRARRGRDEEEGDGRVVAVTGADGGMAAVTGALAAGGVPTRIADTGTRVLLLVFSVPDP
jgi:hypothetical protein